MNQDPCLAGEKIIGSIGIPPDEASQAPINKLGPVETGKGLGERLPHQGQGVIIITEMHGTNARRTS